MIRATLTAVFSIFTMAGIWGRWDEVLPKRAHTPFQTISLKAVAVFTPNQEDFVSFVSLILACPCANRRGASTQDIQAPCRGNVFKLTKIGPLAYGAPVSREIARRKLKPSRTNDVESGPIENEARISHHVLSTVLHRPALHHDLLPIQPDDKEGIRGIQPG